MKYIPISKVKAHSLIPLIMTKRSRSQPSPQRPKNLPTVLVLTSIVLLTFSHPFVKSIFHSHDVETIHEQHHDHDHLTHAPVSKTLYPINVQNTARHHSRKLNRNGVEEPVTTIRQDWRKTIASFLVNVPHEAFSKRRIKHHFNNNIGNIRATTMLVEILNGKVTFTELYKGPHGRASSVKYMVQKIVNEKKKSLPGVTFLVVVNDGYKPRVASFGSARHWNSWKTLIPVPLGNTRGVANGWGTPMEGWDQYVDRHVLQSHSNYTWESKISKALFRGALSMQTHTLGSCNDGGKCKKAKRWDEINRGVMYKVANKRPDLFDVGFTSIKGKSELGEEQFEGVPEVVERMSFQDFQKYKYIINVGSNQDWAERLRSLLFTNSAVVMHEAETKEFFSPLLQPWMHYIPTDVMFTDLAENIEWAVQNDDAVQQIVRNGNAFADRYISERSMKQYWEVAIEEFAKLQANAAEEGLDVDGE